eukprot:TRINITY_DN28586_c0_g1_i1.p1 TRINITY_DN28586_c0_g1~~TRINITY_DN28586_c0_g1_i1.p1  ORF type:complete len:658 (-),score=94.24 TRINITY_DN28586_c0_g1_i1:146-2119(-)
MSTSSDLPATPYFGEAEVDSLAATLREAVDAAVSSAMSKAMRSKKTEAMLHKVVEAAIATQMKGFIDDVQVHLDNANREIRTMSKKVDEKILNSSFGIMGRSESVMGASPRYQLRSASSFSRIGGLASPSTPFVAPIAVRRAVKARKDKKEGAEVNNFKALNEVLVDEILRPARDKLDQLPVAESERCDSESEKGPAADGEAESRVVSKPDSQTQTIGRNSEQLLLSMSSNPEEQEVAEPEQRLDPLDPPPPHTVVPQEPAPEILTSVQDEFRARREVKSTTLVRKQAEEAIVSKATNKIMSEDGAKTESKVAPTFPFVEVYFRKTRRSLCALLVSALTGLALRVIFQLMTSSSAYFLRDFFVCLFAATACVSCSVVSEARKVNVNMQTWSCSYCIESGWKKASEKSRTNLRLGWLAVLAWAVLIESLVMYTKAMEVVKTETEANIIIFFVAELISLLVFLQASYNLVQTAYILEHLLRGLDLFIDKWCSNLVEGADFEQGVTSWNVLQALIRQVGSAIDSAFTVVLTSAFLGCGTVAIRSIVFGLQPRLSWEHLVEACSSLPLLFLALLAGKLFVQCAGITEKCSVIPSIVNQITPLSEDTVIDYDRHYLVHYLTDSAAGIYVKGVRLNMATVVKLLYTFGVGVFAVLGLAIRVSH